MESSYRFDELIVSCGINENILHDASTIREIIKHLGNTTAVVVTCMGDAERKTKVLTTPKGVENLVRSIGSSSSGTWWQPFSASMTVQNFIPGGMVRTAWKGVAVSKFGLVIHSLNSRKSITRRTSPFFYSTAKKGCTHAVDFATFRMMLADSRASNSVFHFV